MSKKLLIREIFEKGKRESGRDSKSGIAYYLSLHFQDNLKFEISDKTFIRYYNALLRDSEEDKNIDTQTLDKMSQYLEFKDFKDFCKTETFTKINQDSSRTSVSVRIDDEDDSDKKHPNITVNITTNPILKFQEFLAKQSGFGLFGLIIFGGFLINNYFKEVEKPIVKFAEVKGSEIAKETPKKEISTSDESKNIPDDDTRIEPPKEEKMQCMFWDGKEYIPAHCSETSNGLIALDRKLVDNFKKITTPDTIASIKNVWYSKHQNVVEFFTSDGVNPENGKELHELSQHMFDKYIKGN
ncbi:hypothetical protein LUD75_08965 [Epilithonimonas sp. JDS]|uniref:hypothetical protein n=1 Tax=Epilithonimonas sp. JDS TaxID=2902797 RepID=UPI001E2A7245|nr:hypothetical protein [Epilithonimonas sp. JDS]MCD9854835.1 hypothetical protein [Epilithonimonas sp. JDS]